jgi:uncharacterized phage protein gp47/JayE
MSKPIIRSYDQLLGEALAAYMAKIGINDLNPNSAIVSLFSANAQMTYRAVAANLQILKDLSIDRASGDLLKSLATEEGVKIRSASPAADYVTVTDTSFTKLATKIYAGAPAPNIGSTTLKVSNTTGWPGTGSIYVGRNTPNIEGPIAYSSITPIGGYFQINLTAPTVKFHNVSESIILAQGGNRNIPANTIVKAPSAGGAEDVTFATTEQTILLDGENTVSSVRVTAQQVGTIGNVPRLAIKEFQVAPFTGASVTNPGPFKNGRDEETDDELRARIKRAKLTRGLGSALAVKNAVLGAVAFDEASSVTSNEIITSGGLTKLYVDDGTGYERKTSGVGLEFIVDSALGGENSFQLATGGRQTGIAKAFLITSNIEPFVIYGGEKLAIQVGGDLSEHIFDAADFQSPGAASAYEIVASINSNYALSFSAATADNGTRITLSAKAEENEDIQAVTPTIGTNASENLGFPSNEIQTLRLYKNSLPLSKNGRKAVVVSAQQSDWSPSIASGDTLIVSIDGTAAITFTFTNQDFIDNTSFATVSPSNDLSAWIDVMNAKLTGLTASLEGQSIRLTSNLGISSRAAISISASSTLVSKGMFTVAIGLSATGLESDFAFSRNTGQLKLVTPLNPGDSLTAGSNFSAARIFSEDIVGATVSFLSSGSMWILVDDITASIIPTGVVSGTEVSVSKPSANVIRYTSNIATSFNDVVVGDYVINWSKELNINNRLEGRVYAKTATTLDMKVTAAEYAAAVIESNIPFTAGFTVLRTPEVPQRIKITAGSYNINTLATLLNAQLVGAEFSVEEDLRFVLTTKSLEENKGALLIVTMETEVSAISFVVGDSDFTKVNHTASYESGASLGEYPAFAHSSFSSESSATPSDSFLAALTSTDNLEVLGYDPNMIVRPLHAYGNINDAQAASEQVVQVSDMVGTTVTLENSVFFKRVRTNDRYFLAYPFDFGHQDSMVIVLDENPSEKTFSVPMYRKAVTNVTLAANSSSFNAYDTDAGPTAAFSAAFGTSFKFDDYKALMKAKFVLDPAAAQDAILYRAAVWGKSGERYNVGYIYPTQPSQGIAHTVVVDKDTNIRISLKSGTAIVTSLNGTTEWNITITPNTPVAGVDQVTYTWSGTGTAPGLGSLIGGEYVTVGADSEFDERNVGTFRVSTLGGFLPTATSFTVARKNGDAFSQNDVATLVAGSVIFFNKNNTTAAEINTYVNANITNWVTSSLTNDGGLTGAGIISLSTGEETNFVSEGESLRDGVNWIATTSLSGSPQFIWKRTLSYPTGTGYAINDGEEIRLIPTTAKQIEQLVNVLAVSGISTLGSVVASRRERRVQISTAILGSEGSVQVAGGSASSLEADIISSSYIVDDYYTRANISASQGTPFISGQLLRLAAENFQEKSTGISSLTTARIVPNYPSAGKSAIQISNRQIDQRFHGGPRLVSLINSRTWKVEKQGKLVCMSWTGVGASPGLYKSATFGSISGCSMSIIEVFGTDNADYKIIGGAANYQEVNIGDRITFTGFAHYGANGDFLVVGKSVDSKTIRVLNALAKSNNLTATITVTNNANLVGDSFTLSNGITSTVLTQGVDFVNGGTTDITATNIAAAISAVAGYSASATLSVVTILRESDGNIYTLSYTDGGSVGATITTFVGETIGGGTMAASLSLKEGDSIIVKSPFNVLNQGTFRLIRTFNNSFYIENDRALDEEIAVPANAIATLGDATTRYNFVKSEYTRMYWNGVGTEPSLNLIKPGDDLTISGAGSNDGTFRVLGSQEKRKQITDVTIIRSQDITTGNYWLLDAADGSLYYVWYNKAGGGGDPAIGGRTGIVVAVGATDTAQQNAIATQLAIDALADFVVTVSNIKIRITDATYGPVAIAVNGNMGVGFSIELYQAGQNTFVEYANAASANASGIFPVTVGVDRPAILFFDYDSAVPGDKMQISGIFLGTSNQGTHLISEVLDRETIVIDTSLTLFDFALLGANENAMFLEEGQKYYGYKVIRQISVEPANSEQMVLVFDTAEQADKINNSGAVAASTLNKLSYPVIAKNGLDSYRYDIGMLAEVNRIVYGDPRDSITYPGVAAAGAEIFNDPPLVRRVLVGIDVRVKTGVPFIQITEQVRNAVAALIDSNPIGQSIAISRIVATVDAIPGVRAIAISSPLYNSANDVIVIQPSEKSLIIDPATDVSVNQLGS